MAVAPRGQALLRYFNERSDHVTSQPVRRRIGAPGTRSMRRAAARAIDCTNAPCEHVSPIAVIVSQPRLALPFRNLASSVPLEPSPWHTGRLAVYIISHNTGRLLGAVGAARAVWCSPLLDSSIVNIRMVAPWSIKTPRRGPQPIMGRACNGRTPRQMGGKPPGNGGLTQPSNALPGGCSWARFHAPLLQPVTLGAARKLNIT